MITNSATDRSGAVLVPEISPGFNTQFGPYEDQVEMIWPGERPVGGGELLGVAPGLNANASDSPARGMSP